MHLVSIVVPVYKVEKYLDECVESILNQSYKNIEVILVDDGSPDRCPQMCDEWAKRDGRIRVIHKQNAGAGEARNTGMEHVTGDYLCFVDSDDRIHPDMIRNAYEYLQKESVDIVLFGMSRIDNEGKLVSQNLPKPPQKVFRGEMVQEKLLPGILAKDPKTGMYMGIPCSVWSIMFNMDLIRKTNWRFVSERQYISEDIYSLLVLFKHIHSAAVLCESLYFYRINPTSLTRTYRDDRYEKVRLFYHQCIALCEQYEYPESVFRACTGPYFGTTIESVKQMVGNAKSISDAIKKLKNILDDDLLQQILRENTKAPKRLSVKWLLWTMQNKKYILCYMLVKLHWLREMNLVKR